MKTYKVSITETLSRLIDVEAETEAEALLETERRWKNENEILGSNDFQDVSFQIEDV